MATLGQFVRAYGAASRRYEREQQRKTREAAKNYKLQSKALEIQNATEAVLQYEDYIHILKSTHKNCTSPINWNDIMIEPEPLKPEMNRNQELRAKKILENYKPSFFDKLFGVTSKKIDNLKKQIESSVIKDNQEFKKKVSEYNIELETWHTIRNIAQKVINNDPEGYNLATEYFKPFDDLEELGAEISLNFKSDIIIIDIKVKDTQVIPSYSLNQTSTGKLTKKELSQSKFNELYQDYVCSIALRASMELLNYFPINFAIVNAISEMLNSQTGQMEDQIILSVAIPPETLKKINLETIDPSDSMKNFVHKMKFTKTNGFSMVEKIEL